MALSFGSVTRRLGLPEMNISEKFGGNKASSSYSKSSNKNISSQLSSRTQTMNPVSYSSAQSRSPSIMGASDSRNTAQTSGSSKYSDNSYAARDLKSSIDDDAKSQNKAAASADKALRAQIDEEFSNMMGKIGLEESRLSGLETSLQSRLPLTEQEITQSYESSIPDLQRTQAQKEADLASQEATARSESGGLISKARQMYNELLSGASRFSGSGAEAFGENLGRGLAQTTNDVRAELTKVLTNIQSELGSVREFYSTKVNDLRKNMNLAIEQARQDFRDQVDKINQARMGLGENKLSAQRWKSTQNLQALANFQQSVADIQSAASVAKRSIDQWMAERSSALRDAEKRAVQQYTFTAPTTGILGQGPAYTPGTGEGTVTLDKSTNTPWIFQKGKWVPYSEDNREDVMAAYGVPKLETVGANSNLYNPYTGKSVGGWTNLDDPEVLNSEFGGGN